MNAEVPELEDEKNVSSLAKLKMKNLFTEIGKSREDMKKVVTVFELETVRIIAEQVERL